MRSLRRVVRIKDGVEVPTLFTPHLFSFREDVRVDLEVDPADTVRIMEAYADILYLAALNAWVLDGKGAPGEFPHTRGDFHEYMAADPRSFGKDVDFAVEALTGKRLRELSAGEEKSGESAGKRPADGKKKRFRWIGRR